VGLCPNEGGVNHFNAFKAFYVFEAHTKELWGLKLQMNPWWTQIAVASFAVLQGDSLRDTLSDINL
jgi:hypothetical protein